MALRSCSGFTADADPGVKGLQQGREPKPSAGVLDSQSAIIARVLQRGLSGMSQPRSLGYARLAQRRVDAAAGCLVLPLDALGVDLKQDMHAVSRPLGNLCCRHSLIEP